MRTRRIYRRGVALLLVISVIGIAVILSLAMLSSASIQAHASSGAPAAARADALAESGLDVALYYLTHPLRMPGGYKGIPWGGASNISFGPGVSGTADVVVTSLGGDMYSITSTGRADVGGGATVKRTITCTAHAFPGFLVRHGAAFESATVTLPSGTTINDTLQVNGTLANYGIVKGRAYCQAVSFPGTLLSGWQVLGQANKAVVPSFENVRDYSTYTYRGKAYSAVDIPDKLAGGTVLGPTETNPAGIFRRKGPLSINGSVTINGTLVVTDPVDINSGSSTITPMAGFPGAVIKKDLCLRGTGSGRSLTINGITYISGSIRAGTALSGGTLNFDGALLVNGGTVVTPFPGTIVATYNLDKVSDVNLDVTIGPPIAEIKVFKK